MKISPEPSKDDAEVIRAALRKTLAREAENLEPNIWTISGWRAGIRDLDVDWSLSNRMPWGGRQYSGLTGRGEAK